MLRLFRQFSTPGGIPSHVERADAGLDPRRRRARLRAGACVRRGVRQPRPDRRVRRSATAKPRPDRSRARGRACASSTRTATARCCRSSTSTATRSADRRCSGAPTTRTWSACSERHGYDPVVVAGDDPATMHEQFAATLDDRRTRRSARSRRRRSPMACDAPALAGDRPAHAEGLDRPRGGRRRAGRGHVPRAPGAARERARQRRAPRHARRVDAQLRARRPLRREGSGSSASSRRSRPRASAGWARTRTRTAARSLVPLDIPDYAAYAVDVPAPGTVTQESTRRLGEMMRDIYVRNPDDLPPVLPGRDALEPARRGVRGREPLHDGSDRSLRRPHGARRARDGGAERAQL